MEPAQPLVGRRVGTRRPHGLLNLGREEHQNLLIEAPQRAEQRLQPADRGLLAHAHAPQRQRDAVEVARGSALGERAVRTADRVGLDGARQGDDLVGVHEIRRLTRVPQPASRTDTGPERRRLGLRHQVVPAVRAVMQTNPQGERGLKPTAALAPRLECTGMDGTGVDEAEPPELSVVRCVVVGPAQRAPAPRGTHELTVVEAQALDDSKIRQPLAIGESRDCGKAFDGDRHRRPGPVERTPGDEPPAPAHSGHLLEGVAQ